MKTFRRFALSTALTLALAPLWTTQASAEPRVIASIKPIHALVSAVMEGVGAPELIVGGAASPHAYALKPSQARALEKAELIFWAGPEFEAFLEKPIETIATKAVVVTLFDAKGLIKLPFREGGPFEADADDDHAVEPGGAFDAHVWLDPLNAKVLANAIAEALSEIDPANAGAYETNSAKLSEKLDALVTEVDATLAPVRNKPFIVFHDAYQYFERRFQIEAAGSVTVNPEIAPSAERVALIRDKVRELGAVCAFAEPQFESQLIDVVIEGTTARTAALDPLGATLDDGPELYFQLIRGLATSMRDCLRDQ